MVAQVRACLLDGIYSSDSQACLSTLRRIKNDIVGSRVKKRKYLQRSDVVGRLCDIISSSGFESPLPRIEAVIILGSLADGTLFFDGFG
jgi:hypothetical protein